MPAHVSYYFDAFTYRWICDEQCNTVFSTTVLCFSHLPLMTTPDIKVNMTPSKPGDFIRTEIIEDLGLSVTKAAKALGVRRATLSDLLNSKSSLSPEMALRVEKAFGTSMDMLLRMQAWHDAAQMRARASDIHVERYQIA